MKTKLSLLALLFAPLAHANLIDLTPGGFNPVNGLPPAFTLTQTQLFFDEAAYGTFNLPTGTTFINGWISRFGLLNGGQFFFSNLSGPTSSALTWWNFNGAPDGDWLTTILVEGKTADGTILDNIYGVPWDDRFLSNDQTVIVDGTAQIFGISFYGYNPANIPDNETSFVLLISACFGLLGLKHKIL